MESKLQEIEKFLGRTPEVIPTGDGRYMVEYFNFDLVNTPTGKTREEAINNFHTWMRGTDVDSTTDS